MSHTPNNYSIAAIIMTIGIIDKKCSMPAKILDYRAAFSCFQKTLNCIFFGLCQYLFTKRPTGQLSLS